MNKQLDQMTNEELGKLFPVIISDPNPNWIKLFQIEKIEIEKMLGKNNIICIEHIGSTAIPRLKAKPTIGILLEVPDSIDKSDVLRRIPLPISA